MKSIRLAATGSPGPRFRVTLLGLLLVAVLGVTPAAAFAASTMEVEAPESVRVDQSFTVTASGTADEDGGIFFYARQGTAPCGAHPQDEDRGNNRGSNFGNAVAEGPYSSPSDFKLFEGGTYTVCGYLSGSTSIQAQGSAVVTVVADSDRDGVYDDTDACPSEAGVDERTNQLTADGCPIRDGDRDGVRNEEDRCPNEAGLDARDGQRTADGCPIRDGDSDGVRDEEDRCPTQRGFDHRNGQRTADGCEIRDTDQDGLVDSADRCPSQTGRQPGTNQPTSDGCPIPDSDFDGVGDPSDRCPSQAGRDPATGAPTPDGCTPADADFDQVPDARDQCPDQRPENGLTGGADPAHPGCPKEKFLFVLVQNYDSFRGIKNKNANLEKRLSNFFILNYGFQRAVGYEFSITLSAASKKATKVSKRKIASTKGALTGGEGSDKARFLDLKVPKPSAADRKKLKRFKKKITFKYEFVAVMPDGQKRKLTRSLGLSKDKATPLQHVVYGSSTNDAGEES